MTLKKRKLLRTWLRAMTGFEVSLLAQSRRNRNAYIKSAARQYEAKGTIPGYLHAAHKGAVEATLLTHYRAVVPFFGTLTERQVGRKGSRPQERKDHFQSAAQEWIATQALRKATLIADTDRDDVLRAIETGFTDGLGTEQIARNIRKVSQLTPRRAATIARTETHAAATYGSKTAAEGMERDFDIRLLKEWLPTMDDRTRESHRAMASHPAIPLDEKFIVEGIAMDRPGDPSAPPALVVACRCALAYSEAG